MQLMVTQLQNQDPLNPSDNQQMAAQLAQFKQKTAPMLAKLKIVDGIQLARASD